MVSSHEGTVPWNEEQWSTAPQKTGIASWSSLGDLAADRNISIDWFELCYSKISKVMDDCKISCEQLAWYLMMIIVFFFGTTFIFFQLTNAAALAKMSLVAPLVPPILSELIALGTRNVQKSKLDAERSLKHEGDDTKGWFFTWYMILNGSSIRWMVPRHSHTWFNSKLQETTNWNGQNLLLSVKSLLSRFAGEFPRFWATGHQHNLSSIKIIDTDQNSLWHSFWGSTNQINPLQTASPPISWGVSSHHFPVPGHGLASQQDVISFNAALTAEDPLAPWRRAAELLRRLRACSAAADDARGGRKIL